jgi:hypothetical protein
LRSVMVTAREVLATSQAVHTVVQILRRVAARKASNGLQLQGRRVTIDRIAVAGSVGKSVTVQGQFDVDLVVFINLPRVQGVVQGLDLLKPEVTCSADWMVSLRRQLCTLLQQQLRRSSQQQQQQQGAVPHCILRCTERPRVGRAAVTFGVAVTAAGVQHGLSFDVLLAPNLASGAGAAAAAAGTPAVTSSSSSSSSSIAQRQPPAAVQCKAVLAPVLAIANKVADATAIEADALRSLQPSFLRNVWLSKASTQFVKQAATAAANNGLSGRVVTSTVRLVKAWVRKGLQQQRGMAGFKRLKSFQVELLVLHAAERLAAKLRNSAAAAPAAATAAADGATSYDGKYVLDLLLLVLDVAQEWAAAAAATSSPRQPVLSIDLAEGMYYSRQQALAVQHLGQWSCSSSSSSSSSRGSGQPLVVHPVDPTCSVFAQAVAPFELWAEFGRSAQLLRRQLLSCSCGNIRKNSTLSVVVA